MLFKLPIMLLSNAPNYPYYAPIMLHCAQLCSIMLRKLLLPESKDYSLSNYIYFKAVESTELYMYN